MVQLAWGYKRTCQSASCGARFYDMRKSPIVCPKCQSTFESYASSRGRRKGSDSAKSAVLPMDIDLHDTLIDDAIDDTDIGLDDDSLQENI